MTTKVDESEPTLGETTAAGTPWLSGTRLMALGMLVLQITWVFAVPPFRGSDEFDHAYRAAAAARGQIFVAPSDATRGTGAWLDVPVDIVKAAQPQCEDLKYTHHGDCIGTREGGSARVASGAGRYNPVFYVVVGLPALPFDGTAALYVMRLATVAVSWLLFCLALNATRRWAKTAWPTAAIALASTPVLLYSSSIVAPNGVEMMAGLVLWTATLGLLRRRPEVDSSLILAAAVGACVLVTTRSLGPLWCLLALVTILVATRPTISELRSMLGRRSSVIAAAAVGAATLLSVAWIVGMGSLNIGQNLSGEHLAYGRRLTLLLRNEPLWTLQSIAAFPLRNEPTRTPVYACYLVLFIGLAVLGFRAARQRPSLRTAIVGAIVLTSAIPFAMGLNPDSYPGLWQGRYALPYSVGIALLIGFALELAGTRMTQRLRVAVLLLFVTAQAIGPVDVLLKGRRHRLSDWADFPHPAPAVLAVVGAAGAALLWWGASRRPDRADP